MPIAADREHTLWHLIAGPTIWSLYFLTCYIATAVYCAKSPEAASGLDPVRILVAVLAVAALGGISFSALRAYRRLFGRDGPAPPHGADTAESREQFVALATLLLCGLSVVATIFVALPALFITTCQ